MSPLGKIGIASPEFHRKKGQNMAELEEELQVEPDETFEDEALVEYDIATYPSDFTLAGINTMWEAEEITIPDFQREFVWTIQQSSLLIESFLLGLPVPPVFFYIDDQNKNLVIDGQQRILSVIFYFEGYFGPETTQGRRQVFRLQGLSEQSPYHLKQFSDLPESAQRKLRGSVLRAINVRQLSPQADNTSIYHIFERLNTGGTPLKPQEIRNCVFRGPIVPLLRQLNGDPNWRSILHKERPDKHQKDLELILRLFALSTRLLEYEKPMKAFLNKTMGANRKADSEDLTRFVSLFPQTTKIVVEKLGSHPFHVRGPLNSAVLDSVFCTILNNLDRLPSDLPHRYRTLVQSPDYTSLISGSTTDTLVIKRRFNLANESLLT